MTKLPAPLVGPSVEAWRAMTPEAQKQFVVEAHEACARARSERDDTPWFSDPVQRVVDELNATAERAAANFERAGAKLEPVLAVVRAAVFAVLEGRGVACPDEQRDRIAACDDLGTLQRWLMRAISAQTAADLFEG